MIESGAVKQAIAESSIETPRGYERRHLKARAACAPFAEGARLEASMSPACLTARGFTGLAPDSLLVPFLEQEKESACRCGNRQCKMNKNVILRYSEQSSRQPRAIDNRPYNARVVGETIGLPQNHRTPWIDRGRTQFAPTGCICQQARNPAPQYRGLGFNGTARRPFPT